MTDNWLDWKDEARFRVNEVLSMAGISLDSVNESPVEMEELRGLAHRQMESSMDGVRDVLSREYDPRWMQIRTLMDAASLSLEELMMRMIHFRILGNSRESIIIRFLGAYADHIGLRGVDSEMIETLVRLVPWQNRDEMEESDE